MIYSAPRQGPFAMIVLASLFLHLLFFVISQEYKLSEQYKAVAENEVVSLAQDIIAPLSIMDNVSMSVIASRYAKHDALAYVGVYDSQGKVIVPVGKESKDGFLVKETITSGSQALGTVVIHTPSVSRAKIISENWAFLLGVLALHALLWFVYGHMARPTKELIGEIADDVRSRLLANGILSPHLQSDKTDKTSMAGSAQSHADETDKPKKVSDFLKAQTANGKTASAQDDTKAEQGIPKDSQDKQDKMPQDTQNATSANPVSVVIKFEDPNALLSTLGVHAKTAYFALCNQLLAKALHELFQMPNLAGVSIDTVKDFEDGGACVVLKADDVDAKVALAGVMLAKLIIMLNQIVYDKHRELRRFCLPMRSMLCQVGQEDAVSQVAKKHRENPLLLVSQDTLVQIAPYAEIGKLFDTSSQIEKDTRHIKKVGESIALQLQTARDNVLLSE